MTSIKLNDVGKRYLLNYRDRLSLKDSFLNLCKGTPQRKEFWALKGIDLDIPKGQALGIIGRNGSGKTTLLRILCGITRPTTGSIKIDGKIAGVLELGAGFQDDLNGMENIYLNGSILGLSKKEIRRNVDSIVDFADIGDFINAPLRTYSAGMYLRLGFAIAAHIDFDILLIDEILAVGDAEFQNKCLKKMGLFKGEGKTIVFVSHNLEIVKDFCGRVIVLDNGRIYEDNMPQEAVHKYRVSSGRKNQNESEISITNIYFKNDKDEITNVFRRGEDMNIIIEYMAREKVMNPVFGIGIFTGSTYLIGPNTRDDDYHIDYVEGKGAIEFRIRDIPFANGEYEVSVSAHDVDETRLYDYHERLFRFRVLPGGRTIKYGLIGINGSWTKL